MSQHMEMEDDREVGRRSPRFGPLLTIAVAILTLFGAVSRLGKPQAGGGLFALDLSAGSRLEQERIRSEEDRLRTIVTLGATQASAASSLRAAGFAAPLDPNPVPPSRGEFDIDSYRRESVALPAASISLSGSAPIGENYDRATRFDPAPEAAPDSAAHPKTYTVQSGDTWVKVAQKTGKRWQDVQKANPSSAGGLRVGMKLVVP